MTHDEIMDLEAKDIAALLNKEVEGGADKAGSAANLGLSDEDLRVANVFWVKNKWMARAWAGYTSTKRSGNELGDTANGVGDSDPSKGFAGV